MVSRSMITYRTELTRYAQAHNGVAQMWVHRKGSRRISAHTQGPDPYSADSNRNGNLQAVMDSAGGTDRCPLAESHRLYGQGTGWNMDLREVDGRNESLPDHTLIRARSNSWIPASKANLKTVQIKRADSNGSGLTLFPFSKQISQSRH